MKKLTEQQVADALQLYVLHRWTGVEFAKHLGVSISYGSWILRGRYWPDILRPEGFEYPWPDSRRRRAKTKKPRKPFSNFTKPDKEEVAKQLHAYFEAPFSAAELGRRLSISRQAAHRILQKKVHKELFLPFDIDDEDELELIEEEEPKLS